MLTIFCSPVSDKEIFAYGSLMLFLGATYDLVIRVNRWLALQLSRGPPGIAILDGSGRPCVESG
jgi:hypothetical protein